MTSNVEVEAAVREQTSRELAAEMDGEDAAKSAWSLDVFNDVEHGRWEAVLNQDSIAELSYRYVGGRMVLLSTWVPPPYRGKGVATELVAHALDEQPGRWQVDHRDPSRDRRIHRTPPRIRGAARPAASRRRRPRTRTAVGGPRRTTHLVRAGPRLTAEQVEAMMSAAPRSGVLIARAITSRGVGENGEITGLRPDDGRGVVGCYSWCASSSRARIEATTIARRLLRSSGMLAPSSGGCICHVSASARARPRIVAGAYRRVTRPSF